MFTVQSTLALDVSAYFYQRSWHSRYAEDGLFQTLKIKPAGPFDSRGILGALYL